MGNKVKKCWSAITTVLVIMVVIIAVLLVGVRIFGIQVFTVMSGSMEPTYHVNSLIYVKKADASEIKEGEPITFALENNTPATHRVVRIDNENECFYTKGDANEYEDAKPVTFSNLIGKPVFSIPYLGRFAFYIQNPPGMYFAVAIAILLVVLAFLPDLIWGKDEKKSKKDEG